MSKAICVVNQKGGVGKTTTAVNLSASLAVTNRRTLLIDLDSQGNATGGLGVDKESVNSKNICSVILGDEKLANTVIDIYPDLLNGYMQLCPANQELTGAEMHLVETESREYRLKKVINEIRDQYDYIFIDSPPSLNLLTINALAAADRVIVPVQCEYYALEGIGQLQRTVSLAKQRLNSSLEVEGYLLTMFDSRNNICKSVAEEVRSHFGEKTFDTVISRNVKLAEAPSHGKPLLLYEVKSSGAQNYMKLANEIIEREEVN
ncbi:MAG: ParA family protein [Candidatus Dadabacteria bacterium]|nr:ParA family protein [Candidatus Dadabacteria bacterium]MCY4261811.1 ParA family protein [Candidatus Dadabacteria bacterium]